jgi:DHA2 family methylenomycin A resistance protein-like MFS transporter
VTAIAALGCLSGAIIKGGALGWSNGLVVTGFIGFLIAAAAFVIVERRAEQPMLPQPMFENRAFSTTALVGFLVNTAFYGLIFVFSLSMDCLHSGPASPSCR